VVRGLLLGLVVQAFVTVAQVLPAGSLTRAIGTLGEPNLLAHAAAIAALAVVAIAPRPLRDGGFALVAAAVVVWLSGSRSGLVGLALGVTALAFVLPRTASKRTAYAFAVVVVVAAGLAAAALSGGRLADPWLTSPDVIARLQVWATAWSATMERPLTGFGHGSVGWVYEFWPVAETGPRHRNLHAHNAGLQVLVSFGVPAFVAFAGACLALVWRTWHRRRDLALVVLLVAFAMNAVDVTLFHSALFLSVAAATEFGTTRQGRSHGG
jgi:O-antigen ligase